MGEPEPQTVKSPEQIAREKIRAIYTGKDAGHSLTLVMGMATAREIDSDLYVTLLGEISRKSEDQAQIYLDARFSQDEASTLVPIAVANAQGLRELARETRGIVARVAEARLDFGISNTRR